MKIRENVPIAELTTMRLGGAARFVVEVEAPEDVAVAYDFARARGLPTYILGGGANTIGRDEGFDGVILVNRLKGIEAREVSDVVASASASDDASKETTAGASGGKDDENTGTTHEPTSSLLLTAASGEIWDDVVAVACAQGYTGIEALSAIPGTAGAAPVQNIGAYGQEVAQTLVSVEAYDTQTREFVTLPAGELGFGYRRSIFNCGPAVGRYFVTRISLRLRKGEMAGPFYNSLQAYLDEHRISARDPQTIREAVVAVRGAKLPDPQMEASAGSFFKNVYVDGTEAKRLEAMGVPVRRTATGGKVNTGWLLEACGLKGRKLHGFRVNEKAALVLINESATSYADLAAARAEIQAAVREKFGLEIEQEPVEINTKGAAND